MRSIRFLLILANTGEMRLMRAYIDSVLTGAEFVGQIKSVRVLSLESPTDEAVQSIVNQVTCVLAGRIPNEHVIFGRDVYYSMGVDPVSVDDILRRVPFGAITELTGQDKNSLRQKIHTADEAGLTKVLFGDKGESHYKVLKAFARQLEKANTAVPA